MRPAGTSDTVRLLSGWPGLGLARVVLAIALLATQVGCTSCGDDLAHQSGPQVAPRQATDGRAGSGNSAWERSDSATADPGRPPAQDLKSPSILIPLPASSQLAEHVGSFALGPNGQVAFAAFDSQQTWTYHLVDLDPARERLAPVALGMCTIGQSLRLAIGPADFAVAFAGVEAGCDTRIKTNKWSDASQLCDVSLPGHTLVQPEFSQSLGLTALAVVRKTPHNQLQVLTIDSSCSVQANGPSFHAGLPAEYLADPLQLRATDWGWIAIIESISVNPSLKSMWTVAALQPSGTTLWLKSGVGQIGHLRKMTPQAVALPDKNWLVVAPGPENSHSYQTWVATATGLEAGSTVDLGFASADPLGLFPSPTGAVCGSLEVPAPVGARLLARCWDAAGGALGTPPNFDQEEHLAFAFLGLTGSVWLYEDNSFRTPRVRVVGLPPSGWP